MDSQNSGQDCILSLDLKVLSRHNFNSVAVLCCSMYHSVAIVFVVSVCLFCRDKVSSTATDLSLAL